MHHESRRASCMSIARARQPAAPDSTCGAINAICSNDPLMASDDPLPRPCSQVTPRLLCRGRPPPAAARPPPAHGA